VMDRLSTPLIGTAASAGESSDTELVAIPW